MVRSEVKSFKFSSQKVQKLTLRQYLFLKVTPYLPLKVHICTLKYLSGKQGTPIDYSTSRFMNIETPKPVKKSL